MSAYDRPGLDGFGAPGTLLETLDEVLSAASVALGGSCDDLDAAVFARDLIRRTSCGFGRCLGLLGLWLPIPEREASHKQQDRIDLPHEMVRMVGSRNRKGGIKRRIA